MSEADIVIIGSGIGGATLAAQLAPSGRRILILERGERMTNTPATRDDNEIFVKGTFRTKETWLDGSDIPFNPGNFYYVGGNSKMYGAVMLRYRAEDFSARRHMGGDVEGWPIGYDLLEPFYQKAEHLYNVRGTLGEDPSEPFHSGNYAFSPVPDEAAVADLRNRFAKIGLHPSSLPLGVNIDEWLSHGAQPFDGFPNAAGGKMDAETVGIAAASQHANVELLTNCLVKKLVTGRGGKIEKIELLRDGHRETIEPDVVICAAGTVNSAALLLASTNENYPHGLANSSDQLGRNFMNHNCSAVLAIHPFRKNNAIYQKTIQVNDYYSSGGPNGEPLGNIQMLGKISANILAANSPLPKLVARWVAKRSLDLYVMSEDLPNPESRVTLKGGQICLDWRRSNWEAHMMLVKKLKTTLRKIGFPIVLAKAFDRRTPSHQCGTARMGHDPKSSVVDVNLKAHDCKNLYIVDASVLPTSAAVNPALTIAALAIRAGEHIARASHD